MAHSTVGASWSRDLNRVVDPVTGRPSGQRVLLWIDAVGGFLVCREPTVTVGQAGPEAVADVPLVADLSREHLRLARQDDVYIATPLAPTWVGGVRCRQPVVLTDGDVLRLGNSVELRFRQPHPLSSSARLEPISRHRPEPAVDGIVLMAQSLVLGPGARCHIVCKDWSAEVVLFRQAGSGGLDGWGCRATGGLTVDGQAQSSPAALTERSRVCGEDFCFSLESLG